MDLAYRVYSSDCPIVEVAEVKETERSGLSSDQTSRNIHVLK